MLNTQLLSNRYKHRKKEEKKNKNQQASISTTIWVLKKNALHNIFVARKLGWWPSSCQWEFYHITATHLMTYVHYGKLFHNRLTDWMIWWTLRKALSHQSYRLDDLMYFTESITPVLQVYYTLTELWSHRSYLHDGLIYIKEFFVFVFCFGPI